MNSWAIAIACVAIVSCKQSGTVESRSNQIFRHFWVIFQQVPIHFNAPGGKLAIDIDFYQSATRLTDNFGARQSIGLLFDLLLHLRLRFLQLAHHFTDIEHRLTHFKMTVTDRNYMLIWPGKLSSLLRRQGWPHLSRYNGES